VLSSALAHTGSPTNKVSTMAVRNNLKTRTNKDSKTVEYRGRITTVDELLAMAKIDRAEWDVVTADINKWEVGSSDKKFGKGGAEREDTKIVVEPLIQVKVKLKKKDQTPRLIQESGDRLLSRLEEAGKKAPKAVVGRATGKTSQMHLLEMGAVDLHMGKYTNARETNSNYDMDIAERLFRASTLHLLEKASREKIDKVLWPVGHDAMHFATDTNATPKGTPMDTAGRYFEVFERLLENYVWAFNESLRVAPVEFIHIPGNHDFLPAYHASRELAAWYRSNKNVTCDVEPKTRKYREYGANMLGFTHGSEEKMQMLPTLMAKEQPAMWGRTIQREIHIGHTHLMRIYGESFAGVRIRILPTLSAHDAWHHRSGYQDRRASEAYLWNFEHGYAGHFSYNVNPS
jgi:hypothetical protein